jgi:hypothetical protein
MSLSIKYILLLLLGAGSLFLSSVSFVDAQIAPKWYCTLFCGIALMIYYKETKHSDRSLFRSSRLSELSALRSLLRNTGAYPSDGGLTVPTVIRHKLWLISGNSQTKK